MTREGSVLSALAEMDSIVEIYTMMQPFDLFVKVSADNMKKLEGAVQDILQVDGVEKSYNFLTVQQKKG
ncbi:MAG TPA: Lrp/AsnC ligand binding domain-containing protein [Methanocella sp.]|nr:Lrp/AsnC ligand binding domain-containing protein [Methanocella sp.]